MAWAVSRWQCMASAVTVRPLMSSSSRSARKAAISPVPCGTPTRPSARPLPDAKALTSATGEAVQRDRSVAVAQRLRQALREPGQAGREGVRVQEPEQPRERVMARDAALQRQELAEEVLLRRF